MSFLSRNGGMIVVSHDRGHTVVELLGNEGGIEVGDVVYGDWLALGGEPIKKAGEPEPFDAYRSIVTTLVPFESLQEGGVGLVGESWRQSGT